MEQVLCRTSEVTIEMYEVARVAHVDVRRSFSASFFVKIGEDF